MAYVGQKPKCFLPKIQRKEGLLLPLVFNSIEGILARESR